MPLRTYRRSNTRYEESGTMSIRLLQGCILVCYVVYYITCGDAVGAERREVVKRLTRLAVITTKVVTAYPLLENNEAIML